MMSGFNVGNGWVSYIDANTGLLMNLCWQCNPVQWWNNNIFYTGAGCTGTPYAPFYNVSKLVAVNNGELWVQSGAVANGTAYVSYRNTNGTCTSASGTLSWPWYVATDSGPAPSVPVGPLSYQ